ncbi:MAG: hypothetical protein DRJ32_02000 [Thermoprotei archaeon]|nr:MAG: hypothetical protein DRJ32_02000 [Thermoprotei archaeon]
MDVLRIAFLVPHDFRYSNWSIEDYITKYHYSKKYAAELASRGHEVTVHLLHQDISNDIELELKDYRIFFHPSSFYFPPKLRFGNAHNLRIYKYVLRDEPDIVHVHYYYAWSTPYVIALLKRHRLKIVLQHHGECDLLKEFRVLFSPLYALADLYLIGYRHELLYVRKLLARKIVYFPNVGVDPEVFKPVEMKSDRPLIVYAGRMIRERRGKRPDLIIYTLKVLTRFRKDFKAYLIGDGPERSLLEQLVNRLNLSRFVTFTGHIDQNKLVKYLSKAWILFHPVPFHSLDLFWDGIVKEAYACETPVLALSKLGKVKQYRYGILLPYSPASLAKYLNRLLSNPDELFNMGKSARKYVIKYCSWSRIISKLEKIYEKLAKN